MRSLDYAFFLPFGSVVTEAEVEGRSSLSIGVLVERVVDLRVRAE